MNEFKTILDKCVSAEVVEKKSRFIANLFYVESSDEAEQKVKEIKKRYHDAKHNCFAYLINESNNIIKKFSDDGEPSGTAGAPMLEILEKTNLCNVVIVVTRYFGGILLGTGGLVRAYSEALKAVISASTIVMQEPGYEVSIKIAYSNFEKFKYYCGKKYIKIISTTYSDIVICKVEINEKEKQYLSHDIQNENNFKIVSFDIIRQKNISIMSNLVD